MTTTAAEQRLFSAPAQPNEKEICAEWKLYVEPELRRLFRVRDGNGRERSAAVEWKPETVCQLHAAHSD